MGIPCHIARPSMKGSQPLSPSRRAQAAMAIAAALILNVASVILDGFNLHLG